MARIETLTTPTAVTPIKANADKRMLGFGRLLVAIAVLMLINGDAKSDMTDKDAVAARVRRDYPERGFLIFDATIIYDGKPRICALVGAELKSADGQTQPVDIRYIPGLFGLRPADGDYGVLASLSPGLWRVTGIGCGRLMYEGDFGEIQIRSGEIINAGYLVLDVHGRAGRTHTEDLTPLTVASIKKRLPLTFGKAVKRYFTVRRP